MKHRAGYTLIELMITIAILGITAQLLATVFMEYQLAARRARAMAAVAEVLDQELEAARACGSRRCIDALVRTGTSATARPEGTTWLAPTIERSLRPGPEGTVALKVTASIPGLIPPRTLNALLEVPR